MLERTYRVLKVLSLQPCRLIKLIILSKQLKGGGRCIIEQLKGACSNSFFSLHFPCPRFSKRFVCMYVPRGKSKGDEKKHLGPTRIPIRMPPSDTSINGNGRLLPRLLSSRPQLAYEPGGRLAIKMRRRAKQDKHNRANDPSTPTQPSSFTHFVSIITLWREKIIYLPIIPMGHYTEKGTA